MLRILSLGAGTQSTTIALLVKHGELPALDCAIFADTGDELPATYDHLHWLTGCELVRWTDDKGRPRVHAQAGAWASGVLPFPVHVAQAWQEGLGNPSIKAPLGDEVLNAARGIAKPGSEASVARGMHSRPPFFTLASDGSKGMIRRQCTGDYKIDVIQAKERALLGLKRGQRWPKQIMVEQWIGISRDEASRMAPVRQRLGDGTRVPHPTIRGRWPLIDAGFSRADCERWLTRHGYPIPPKSACMFCPFHSDAEWRRIKADPPSWERTIELDRAIRTGLTSKGLTGALYLHASRMPLEDVDLRTDAERGQPNLFENECAGVCGV